MFYLNTFSIGPLVASSYPVTELLLLRVEDYEMQLTNVLLQFISNKFFYN